MLENARSTTCSLLYADAGNVGTVGPAVRGADRERVHPDAAAKPGEASTGSRRPRRTRTHAGRRPRRGVQGDQRPALGLRHRPGVRHAKRMQGFVKDSPYTIGWETTTSGRSSRAPRRGDHGRFHTRKRCRLVGAAKGYAVCDHWFAPRRPRRCEPVQSPWRHQQGHMDDHTKSTPARPSSDAHERGAELAGLRLHLAAADQGRLPRHTSAGLVALGLFKDFRPPRPSRDAGPFHVPRAELVVGGTTASIPTTRVGPRRAAHPRHLRGRCAPVPAGGMTLFVLTYDEHGGCLRPVPRRGRDPADNTAGEFASLRPLRRAVPTLLISPLIPPDRLTGPRRVGAARPHLLLKTIGSAGTCGRSRPRRGAPASATSNADDPRTDDVLAASPSGLRQRGAVAARSPTWRRSARNSSPLHPEARPAASPPGARAVVQDPDQRPPRRPCFRTRRRHRPGRPGPGPAPVPFR